MVIDIQFLRNPGELSNVIRNVSEKKVCLGDSNATIFK